VHQANFKQCAINSSSVRMGVYNMDEGAMRHEDENEKKSSEQM
jgi:hypothetical protein